MTAADVVLVAAGTLTALTTGLLFGFSVAVMPGLGRLDDRGFLAAFQRINVAIQNPVFGVAFAGPVLLLPLAAVLGRAEPGASGLVLAALLYVVGGVGVTMARNVPLNNRLDRADLTAASPEELAGLRQGFERPWNRWHAVRTLATTAAVALVLVAAVQS